MAFRFVKTFTQNDINLTGSEDDIRLNDVSAVASIDIFGTTYVYVGNEALASIQVFTLDANGTLSHVEGYYDDATTEFADLESMEIITIGGNDYLVVVGENDSAISVFSIGADGLLTQADAIVDPGPLELLNVQSVVTFFVGTTAIAVAGGLDDGLSVFTIDSSGMLTNTDNVPDTELSGVSPNELQLDGLEAIATAEVSGTRYIFTGGRNDGISVFSVSSGGILTNVQNLNEDNDAGIYEDTGTKINDIEDMTTAVVGGTTYLFAASQFDGNSSVPGYINVYSVAANGTLTLLTDRDVDTANYVDQTAFLDTVEIAGQTFLLVSNDQNNASYLTAFLVGNDGSLTRVRDLFNDTEAPFENFIDSPGQMDVVTVDGNSFALVGSPGEAKLEVFRVEVVDPVWLERGGEEIGFFTSFADALAQAQSGDYITADYDYAGGAPPIIDIDNLTFEIDAALAIGFVLDSSVGTFTLFGTATVGVTVQSVSGATVNGSDGENAIVGGGGNDTLIGGGGNDTIDGLGGNDNMVGGEGDDIFVVDSAGDTVSDGAGEGTDQVNSHVGFTLFANLENLSLLGTANVDAIGNELDNNIFGNAGNNTLDGLTGADTMIGGLGDDIYVVDNVGDSVSDSPDGGTDQVNSYVSFTLFAHLENLSLLGSADIDGIGNELDNTIFGNAGNNTLDGLGGADDMRGGLGDDIYVVDNAGDSVSDSPDGYTDQVNSHVSFVLFSYLENLSLLGSADIDAIGNELDNNLFGNSGNNTLDGLTGADLMVGGDGDDIYVVDNVGDVVSDNPGAGGGVDQLNSSVSFTLFANLEHLSLLGSGNIDATGNELDNNLFGNSGNNVIIGNAGNDLLIGNGGNDTYVFGDGCDDDIITDFSAGSGAGDVLNVAAFGFADFAAVLAATDDSGGSGPAVIQLDGDDSITLQGVLKADLAADDFVLA